MFRVNDVVILRITFRRHWDWRSMNSAVWFIMYREWLWAAARGSYSHMKNKQTKYPGWNMSEWEHCAVQFPWSTVCSFLLLCDVISALLTTLLRVVLYSTRLAWTVWQRKASLLKNAAFFFTVQFLWCCLKKIPVGVVYWLNSKSHRSRKFSMIFFPLRIILKHQVPTSVLLWVLVSEEITLRCSSFHCLCKRGSFLFFFFNWKAQTVCMRKAYASNIITFSQKFKL